MSSPLLGRHVVVTRPLRQTKELADQLTTLGAAVTAVPLTRIVPINESREITRVLGAIACYDVIVITSVNGAECFADQLHRAGCRPAERTTIVAVGAATSDALRGHGIRVDRVPHRATGPAIVAELTAMGVAGRRILLPRAQAGRPELSQGLRAAGAEVDDVALYDTVRCDVTAEQVAAASGADAIVITAPSGAEALAALTPDLSAFAPRIVTIGPTTSAAARSLGFAVAAESREQSAAGIVAALRDLLGASR